MDAGVNASADLPQSWLGKFGAKSGAAFALFRVVDEGVEHRAEWQGLEGSGQKLAIGYQATDGQVAESGWPMASTPMCEQAFCGSITQVFIQDEAAISPFCAQRPLPSQFSSLWSVPKRAKPHGACIQQFLPY